MILLTVGCFFSSGDKINIVLILIDLTPSGSYPPTCKHPNFIRSHKSIVSPYGVSGHSSRNSTTSSPGNVLKWARQKVRFLRDHSHPSTPEPVHPFGLQGSPWFNPYDSAPGPVSTPSGHQQPSWFDTHIPTPPRHVNLQQPLGFAPYVPTPPRQVNPPFGNQSPFWSGPYSTTPPRHSNPPFGSRPPPRAGSGPRHVNPSGPSSPWFDLQAPTPPQPPNPPFGHYPPPSFGLYYPPPPVPVMPQTPYQAAPRVLEPYLSGRYGPSEPIDYSYPHGGSGVADRPHVPYIPVDPFQPRPLPPQTSESHPGLADTIPLPASYNSSPSRFYIGKKSIQTVYHALTDTAPRQLYLLLLLHIPSLYFSRVTRVFKDAELSMPDIKDMVIDLDSHLRIHREGLAPPISPALVKFRHSWEEFVASLMSEWQTQNILAVLLLSAVLTMLQIQNVEGDPIMRTAALLSLVCALMSLLYGCIYMSRFGIMNKMYKAASWAVEAQETGTLILWNVWVFLAMPAVWLAWSIISFIVCVLAFVWRTGSTLDEANSTPLLPRQALGPRIAITGVFALGFLYFIMIMKTLKRYGSAMDREWKERVTAWRKERLIESSPPAPRVIPPGIPPAVVPTPPPSRSNTVSSNSSLSDKDIPSVFGPYRAALLNRGFRGFLSLTGPRPNPARFKTIRIVDMNNSTEGRHPPPPEVLSRYDIREDDWNNFIGELNDAWDGKLAVPNLTTEACLEIKPLIVSDLIHTWNTGFFITRGLEVILSAEHPPDSLDRVDNSWNPPTLPPVLYLACTTGTSEGRSTYPPVPSGEAPSVPEGGLTDTESSESSPRITPPVYPSIHHVVPPTRPESRTSSFSGHPSTDSTIPHQINILTVPGPYRKALQHNGTTPNAFSRDDVSTSDFPWAEAWRRFTTDLGAALVGDIPVPNMLPSARLQMRSVIIADLMDTWNTEVFLRRGTEYVFSTNTTPAKTDMESGTRSDINDRGYPPSPFVIYLNPGVLGLGIQGKLGTSDIQDTEVLTSENISESPTSLVNNVLGLSVPDSYPTPSEPDQQSLDAIPRPGHATDTPAHPSLSHQIDAASAVNFEDELRDQTGPPVAPVAQQHQDLGVPDMPSMASNLGVTEQRRRRSWYRPARPRPPSAPVPAPPTLGQPEDVPPTYLPMPAGPNVVQLPPLFENIMEILRENRLAQLATVDQQRELMRYMRGLNEWLGRDIHDRQSELRGVLARVDQLRTDLNEFGMGMRHGDDPPESSDSNSLDGGFQPHTFQRRPMGVPEPQPFVNMPGAQLFQGPSVLPPGFAPYSAGGRPVVPPVIPGGWGT